MKKLFSLLNYIYLIYYLNFYNHYCLLKKRKKDNITRDNIFTLYLSQIPGVSKSIGKHLSKTYKTMSEFILYLNSLEKTEDKIDYLANIEVDIKNNKTRKIGKKIASRIIEFLF